MLIPTDTQRRIMELTGCDRDDAVSIDLMARIINRAEQLRAVEDLSTAEFATLITRAKILTYEMRRRICDYLEGKP